jgi:hypothetical protein
MIENLRYRSLEYGEIQHNELRRFATQIILLHNKNYPFGSMGENYVTFNNKNQI